MLRHLLNEALLGFTIEDLNKDEEILGDLLYSWKQEYKKGFDSLFQKAIEFYQLMEQFEVTYKRLRKSRITVVTEIAVFRAAFRDTTEMLQKILKDKKDFPHKYEEVQLFNAESLDFISYCLDSWSFAKKNSTNPSKCREMRDKTLNMIKKCIFDVQRFTKLLTSEIELLKSFNNSMEEHSEEEIKKIFGRIKRVYKLLYHTSNWRFQYSTEVTIQQCGLPPKSNIPLLYS